MMFYPQHVEGGLDVMRFPKRIESIQESIGSGRAEWGIVIEEKISFGSFVRFLCLVIIITIPFYKVYGVSYGFLAAF